MGSCALRAAVRASVVSLAFAACASDDADLASTQQAIVDLADFTLPSLSDADRAAIVHKYDHLDPDDVVPRGLLEDAMVYYDVNLAMIPKHAYFVVVDFSLYSGKDRFWMVDLATGAVETHKVAHGSGSDPDNNGYATLFSNTSGSYMSSLGFYLTGEIYDGTHPHSMRLDGLSPDGSPNNMANTNVRDRLVVVHEASYVDDGNTSQQGRSNGCLALDPSIEASVVDRIHDGTLIYGALSPLNPPVGRCDGCSDTGSGSDSGSGSDGGSDGAADDPGGGDNGMAGGCSTTYGNSSALFGLALLIGARRRRRRTA
jgi:hypothetical protein